MCINEKKWKPILHRGKIILQFDEKLVDEFYSDRIPGSRLYRPDYNQREVTDHDVELATVIDSWPDSFFQPGDTVLVHYDVFRLGVRKFDKETTKKVYGTEYHVAWDGSQSVKGITHQVFAKLVDGAWVPAPDTCLIAGQPPAKEKVTAGGIIVPQNAGLVVFTDENGNKESDIENPWSKPFWSEVLYSNMPAVAEGDDIMVQGYWYVPINLNNMAFVVRENIMAKKEKKQLHPLA